MSAPIPIPQPYPAAAGVYKRFAVRSGEGVAAAAGAPQWWTDLAERTWTEIAGGTGYSGGDWQKGATLANNVPDPEPYGTGQVDIVRAWNGGCSLQGRREYLKVAEGGHNAYYGNEIYALALGDAVPGWKRIWGPTPNASLTTTNPANRNAPYMANADDTPRTMHGWFRRIATEGTSGERLWTLATGASPDGEYTSDIWSIARSGLGTGVYDPDMWVYHGRHWTDATVPYSYDHQSGPSAFDPVANVIWTGAAQSTEDGFLKIDIAAALTAGFQANTGPQVSGSTLYDYAYTAYSNGWSVLAENASPRCWIIGSPSGNNIHVLNVESPGTIVTRTASDGSVSDTVTRGAVYHEASGKIIVFGPRYNATTDATVRVLTVPSDPYNTATGWSWSTLTNAGGSISSVSQFQGSFSAAQIIQDMGDGRSCLVVHSRDVTGPSYVYKLPETL